MIKLVTRFIDRQSTINLRDNRKRKLHSHHVKVPILTVNIIHPKKRLDTAIQTITVEKRTKRIRVKVHPVIKKNIQTDLVQKIICNTYNEEIGQMSFWEIFRMQINMKIIH